MSTIFSEMTDNELLSFLKQGKEGAFTEIYNRYWKKLLSVAANKTHELTIAEDLVQDIFSDLWLRRDSLMINGELNNYLAVSLKYRVINYQARQKRARQYQQTTGKLINQEDYTPQEWLQFEELRNKLALLVASLPERCQLAYRLRKEEGLSQIEISKFMNISEKAVERNLTRACKVLRTAISKVLTIFF